MIWTESNKDPMTIMQLPFWEFTTLLKCGIQEVDSKTPHVNLSKLVVVKYIGSEDIIRRNVLIIVHVLANIGVITISHLPQV